MRCFYCKCVVPKEAEPDICDTCIFHLDEIDTDYDYETQRDIEDIVNKTGVTPARFIE